MNLAEQLHETQRSELEWRGKFYASQHALRAANRGLSRLSRQLQRLKSIQQLRDTTAKIDAHYRQYRIEALNGSSKETH